MIEAFKEEIYKTLKPKYESILKDNFNTFFISLSGDIKMLDNIHNKDFIVKNLNRAIKTTKTRWVNKLLKNNNSTLSKEIEFSEYQYKMVLDKTLPLRKYKSYFGVKNSELYKAKLIEKIMDWKRDDNSLLTEFMYLSDLSKVSIRTAFKNDILIIYSRYDKEIEIINNNVTKVPSILGDIPIDTTGRVDLLTKDQKITLDKSNDFSPNSTIDRFIMIGQEEQNELLIQLEQSTYLQIKSGGNPLLVNDLLTQIAFIKAVKYLNRIDVKIIRYYYTHFHKMVLGEPIIKSIHLILKDIGLTDGKKNYEAVEDSIAKLGSIKLSYNIEGTSVNGVFLESKIYTLNGTKIAEVYLGNILKELIIKKSTLEYDESVFNSLSDDSQQLAIWLQKRRYRAEINKKSFNEDIYLNEFSTAIYWNTKNHYRQRDRIKASLEELKNNKIIIKDFTYYNKMFQFNVEYRALSSKEKAKLEVDQDRNYELNPLNNQLI
ncbi:MULTISPECIES: hypothetical protein [unclassified Clostridium]|uniref:hypothetical protein n=1 Tax=unclassified Clostridium TaxID=2614128 RepID=UPI001A9BD1FE|nr:MULTISPECIES: hypothetical protein [unclassified Clostridium]MBZ9693452.1 hypothetical protein [Clostridium sp. M14]